jgi:hypothetical protein
MKRYLISLFIITTVLSCRNAPKNKVALNSPEDFDAGSLQSGMIALKRVSGQLLYLPVYSNVPYQIDTLLFDKSAFVAIHNTDFSSRITLTKVLYFNQDGKLVDNFLKEGNIFIDPLATKDFYIPYADQSRTGANFLIEWSSDSLVNEPLIEAVTLSLKPNSTLAVLSQGKIMREKH